MAETWRTPAHEWARINHRGTAWQFSRWYFRNGMTCAFEAAYADFLAYVALVTG